MGHLQSRELWAGAIATVRDVVCCAPRAPAGPEEHASGYLLLVPRAGVFVRHAVGGRRELTADAAHALFFNAGEAYRVSHPADGGDRSTVLAFPVAVAREVAAAHDRATWRDDGPVFRAPHALVAPAVRLRVSTLRAALAAPGRDDVNGGATGGWTDALACEEEALAILSAVLADTTRAYGRDLGVRARGPLGAPRRPATRAAHRDLAESVKEVVARAPGASLSLAALGRVVAASPYHLTRTFHAEVGVPVHQYRLRLRLALALERLADPATALGPLALELGFAHHAHFARAFRRAYGLSPTAARAVVRGRRPRLAPRPGVAPPAACSP